MADNKKSNDAFNSGLIDYDLEISIKGVDLIPDNVKVLTLREWYFDVLPRLDLVIVDDGVFVNFFPLEDNDIISIKLSNNTEDDPIVAEFMIESYEIINTSPGEMNGCVIEIAAVLKNTNLIFPLKTRSFANKKSSEVFSEIASEVGFDYESKIDTNDVMNWLQINETNLSFLNNTIKKSFFREDDAVLLYTQLNNKLFYTSIKTEISKDINYELVYNPRKTLSDKSNNDVLEKEEEGSKNVIYFDDFQIYNISPLINKDGGYGSRIVYSNGGEEVIEEQTSDNFELTTNSNKIKENVGEITKILIERNISNNVHDNYFKSILQNDRLKKEYFTSYTIIDIKPNTEVNLMDKVNLSLPALSSPDYDYVNSGEYLVGGIIYSAQSNSIFRQRLILFRNGTNIEHSSLEKNETKLS